MKIGDMIKLKRTGEVGLIVEKIRRCVPDGNPNGDFNIEEHYRVSIGDRFVMIPRAGWTRVAEVVR
tara:strand:+ start:40 stop:237 length:198 start_codon:yes stop_codon:yes gene_type:complete